MFQMLFERSAEAIFLLDTKNTVFVDCNAAAVAMMRCENKAQLLAVHPAKLSAERQPDGCSSVNKTAEMIALTLKQGSHRFEWMARRFTGEDFLVEVVLTPIQFGEQPLIATVCREITERKQAEAALRDSERKLRLLFESSLDSILILDPERKVCVDCNEAAVRISRGGGKEWLVSQSCASLAPEFQPSGRRSDEMIAEWYDRALKSGPQRFEWMGRTFTGEDLPLEVQLSPVTIEDRTYLVAVSRDITERRKTDAAIRELNASLERRIEERTAELAASEARARTLVENAPEAIVVFDGSTGRFLVCNENAMTLYGLSREELLQRGPAEVSPEFQPDGRPSAIAAREKIQEALDGKAPVFEWLHKHSSGRLLPCEVRLVRLPAGDKPLVRGSVIDNTERRRREKIQQATYQISEAVHTAEDLGALYLRIHGIIKELMPAENFYIAMFDPVTELISFPYYVDEISPQPTPFKPNTGLTGYVLRTGKPMRMDRSMAVRKRRNGQLVSFDGFPEISYIESGTPAAIWMGVPLTVHGRPLGVMAVQDYRNEEAYGEEEMKILTFVAGQIALAIERKRAAQIVFQRAEQIQRHRNALLELALLDKSKLDLALETICARAATVLNVARVGYWSLKSDPAALECEVLYRLDLQATDASFKGTRVESTSCPAYFRALTSKEPIVANHVEFNPATEELIESYLNPLGISSMLDVPVWLNGKLVGVLCEEHTGEPRDWTSEEVDFAAAVANMVSLSLEAAQRARSEQALRESEEKFRALFEATSQGVILHDEDKFLELNPAAVRLLGHDNAAAIIGRHPADMSAPIQAGGESAATLSRKHIADCIAKGSTRFDWICRSGSGQEIQIEVILTRIQMAGRQIIQAVMNDISERKRAEAELLKSLAREKELGQLKSSFVSMVSHEFRTPLGIIMSSADILSDYFDRLDPDERRIHLESIHQNTRRMSELMEEVLLIGRLDAGKMDFKPAPVELPAFCRRLKDEIMAATEARCPIQLEITPECTEAHADERLLRHIFANLLTNAVKYSEHNTPIEFNMSRCGRDAVGVIRDRGIGIPESDQEWIFNAFHRARNVGQRPGTGLGLGIVKRCVELHGGRIRVESKVGEGTTMTVRLPVFAAE